MNDKLSNQQQSLKLPYPIPFMAQKGPAYESKASDIDDNRFEADKE